MGSCKRLLNLALDIICVIGCAACAVQYICLGLLSEEPLPSRFLQILLGLAWLACSALWVDHIDRLLAKSPGRGAC